MLNWSTRSNLRSKVFLGSLALLLASTFIGCKPNGPAQAQNAQAVDEPPVLTVFPAQRAKADLCKLGAKLRDNNDAQKMITGIPGKLLDVKVGTVLDIQIPQAIQLFKASEGRVPKNHAEFLARVCEPNNIKLPDLIDGMVYQFNPEREELWAYPADEVPVEK
jgi:hypothetical protein